MIKKKQDIADISPNSIYAQIFTSSFWGMSGSFEFDDMGDRLGYYNLVIS